MEKEKKLSVKENLKRLIVNLGFFFTMLMYWEVLLFYQLHNSLEGFTVWNVLFIVPIAFLLSSLTGWFHEHQKLNDVNRANAMNSSGSIGNKTGAEFFTPDEVRAMSQSEVRANYQRIIESMKKWN